MLLLAALLTFQLGDFRLESGEVVRNCQIGYRVEGTLNADRSNAILVPTWFGGRSEDMLSSVGAGKLFDSAQYYIILVDAFGNGISSSPSNNPAMPRFSMRDNIRAQYELVTRGLKLEKLYAVAGLSMGGMQALQWAVSYPHMMTRVVSIAGTPKQTSGDLIFWKTQLDLLQSASDRRKAMRAIIGMNSLSLYTPAWFVKNVPDADAYLANRMKSLDRLDPADYISQLHAIIGHDIGPVTALEPRALLIVALQDQLVNPTPSRQLAKTIGADLVTLSGDCGHIATSCEGEIVRREVTRFLSQ
jgi:homoserine O-acetyltransferase